MTASLTGYFPCLTGNLQGKYAFLVNKFSFRVCRALKTLRFLPNFPKKLTGKFIRVTGNCFGRAGKASPNLIIAEQA